MKKYFKWLCSLLTALVLVVQTVPVNAQANVAEVLTKANEASKNLTSGRSSGFLSVSIDNQGQSADLGQVNFDVKFNLDSLSGAAKLDVVSAFLGGQNVSLEAYLKDNVVTMLTPEGATVETLTEAQIAEWNAGYAKYKEAVAQADTAVSEEEVTKFFDFTETDAGYVLSLKEGIDGKAFYEEANKDGALDTAKEQTLKQLEEQGQEVSAEMKQTYDKIYSPEFFELIFASNPKLEITYAKDTYYVNKFVFDFQLDVVEFVKFTGAASEEEVANLPNKVNIKGEVNLSEQGQPQEVMVPEVTVESTEESSSSAE